MEASFASALSGVIVASGVGVVLYLGAPRQPLRQAPLAARTTFVLVVTFGAVAIALLRKVLGPAEAVYAAILVVIITTTALPFLAAAFGKNGRSTP